MGVMSDNGTSTISTITTGTMSREQIERNAKIRKAWDAYHGRLSPPLKVKPGRPDDNVSVNLCRTTVNKGIYSLFGRNVTFSLDETSTERSDEEAWLDAVWRANKKKTLLTRLAMNGAVAGHAFIKISLEEGFEYPRLRALDPTNVSVKTKEDDYTEVVKYTIQWKGTYRNEVTGNVEDAIYRQVIERSDQAPTVPLEDVVYVAFTRDDPVQPQTADGEIHHWRVIDQVTTESIVQYTRGTSDTQWKTLNIDIWEWEFPPIVDCQNLPSANEFWGISDLEPDVIVLQQNITRALSNINRILRLHAHPKTWARGLSDEQIRTLMISPDGLINIPNPDAELRNLEMTSDMSSSIEFYNKLREEFHEATGIPEVTKGKTEYIGAISGIALQILYGPVIEKTEVKRELYGELLIELNRRLLVIEYGDEPEAGQNELEDVESFEGWEIILGWEDIVPASDEENAKVALMDYQLGVSRETLIRKRGYDPAQEKVRREKEAKAALKEAQAAMDQASRGQDNSDPFGRNRTSDSDNQEEE